METNDPKTLNQLLVRAPEYAAQISKQMGIVDDATKSQVINDVSAFAQMMQRDPEGATAYWQENLSENPTFAGLADNFASGNPQSVIDELGFGLVSAGGMKAYDAVFNPGKDVDSPSAVREWEYYLGRRDGDGA